jgi:thymidine kinase
MYCHHHHHHHRTGKSTRLLELARDEACQQRRVALVKSRKDSRYVEGSLNTHDGVNTSCFVAGTLAEFKQQVSGVLRVLQWAAVDSISIAAVGACVGSVALLPEEMCNAEAWHVHLGD